MRFMLIRKADDDTEAGKPPSAELLAAMMDYNEQMAKAGVMLQGVGLHASSKGSRVRFSRGKPAVHDGPFAETKELIAGFTIIQVESKEEAIEWVRRWPAIDHGGNFEIEIRQVIDPEDFGAEFGRQVRKQEELLKRNQIDEG
jgi:hypothetical protein